jgi:hypothetical protein
VASFEVEMNGLPKNVMGGLRLMIYTTLTARQFFEIQPMVIPPKND